MIYTLWMFGLVLIFLEFYLPGAVLGICGGVLLLASIAFFAMKYGADLPTFIYVFCVGLSFAAVIWFALWLIPRGRKGGIYSNASQEGYVASSFDPETIGKKGIVVSDLKPGGYISVDGKQSQALSESGYISEGEEVIVLRGEGESLIVRKMKG
jgi:membrane-bound ClpP family serine protease